jgi:hypothetical protein
LVVSKVTLLVAAGAADAVVGFATGVETGVVVGAAPCTPALAVVVPVTMPVWSVLVPALVPELVPGSRLPQADRGRHRPARRLFHIGRIILP